ncbi:Signal recognition particle subunit SRP72 [Nymphon striatum]|nr:Signal recognition particle subunit SRP72 [Nymphon striatum]
MSSTSNLSTLYAELNKYGQSGEYFRALKFVNKILQDTPNDAKAIHCKVVCLVQESRFQDALSFIQKNKNKDLVLDFEKAYCYYRLNNIKEALSTLKQIKNPSQRETELKAQILYRLEDYQECYKLYKEMIKDSADDYEEERETNFAAVVAGVIKEDGNQLKSVPKIREDTYELCYNSACIILNQGKIIEAVGKLQQTEELCRKSLEEDELGEEEIEAEVAVVRTQLAYAKQLLKKNDEALNIYNQVLKQRPADAALVAVASNNIVTIHKDQNVFDSKKKIKQATADGLENKLTNEQQFSIAVNQCLLSMYTNQQDVCKRQAKALITKYPTALQPVYILAAALLREKRSKKAIELLKEQCKNHPKLSLDINLVLTQLLLSLDQMNEACEILKSMGDSMYRLGVVSTLVAFYQRLNEKKLASKILKDAVEWHKNNKTNPAAVVDLLTASSQFHLQSSDPEAAAKCLEELRKINKNDMKVLAKLISAYSQFDPKKSQEISKDLPQLETTAAAVDVDRLEASHWSLGAKYVKKAIRTEPSPASGGKVSDELMLKKKKKKKKGKLPKNSDLSVDPDPERWIPRKERSTYRRKKDKRGLGIGKGTQGSAAGASDYLDASKNMQNATPSPASATPVSPQVAGSQGPRQQRPQATQKKKRKKGGKW